MEPVLKAVLPLIALITGYLAYRGFVTSEQAAKIGDLAAAALTAIGGIIAVFWARSKVVPVKALPDGSYGVVSDAAVVGNVPLRPSP